MKPTAGVWKARARALDEARQAARRGSAGSAAALRRELRAVSSTADALGHAREKRLARGIARSIARARRLAVERHLLDRVGRLGLLSPEAVAALAARWEQRAGRAAEKLLRAADGRRTRRLRRRLARLSRREPARTLDRIVAAHRRAESAAGRSLDGKDDGVLVRVLRASRRARSLAEDLAAMGLPEPPGAERDRALDDRLSRWHDLRAFGRRLAKSRAESARRGTVGLAAEIERLLAVLEPALASARSEAVAASGSSARVLPMRAAARG
ncbi:MAG: hypothetical protein ACM3NW_07510 [Syntrophomonadaceae bacterium]